ncbi:MAG TPA: response regulator [Ramlibacter sp.]|nr:response regulator [Ramlibacter sp.]
MPQDPRIRVFLADDSVLIRSRVGSLLEAAGATVVGEAETPLDSIEGILCLKPDVVVLDAHLRGGSGLQVLRGVHAQAPEIHFVVFTNNASAAYRTRYLQDGARQFLDKSSQSGELSQAVMQAARHQTH